MTHFCGGFLDFQNSLHIHVGGGECSAEGGTADILGLLLQREMLHRDTKVLLDANIHMSYYKKPACHLSLGLLFVQTASRERELFSRKLMKAFPQKHFLDQAVLAAIFSKIKLLS